MAYVWPYQNGVNLIANLSYTNWRWLHSQGIYLSSLNTCHGNSSDNARTYMSLIHGSEYNTRRATSIFSKSFTHTYMPDHCIRKNWALLNPEENKYLNTKLYHWCMKINICMLSNNSLSRCILAWHHSHYFNIVIGISLRPHFVLNVISCTVSSTRTSSHLFF